MSVDTDRNVVLRGEAELVERAGRLFFACEEFAVSIASLSSFGPWRPSIVEQSGDR
ncbi:hypothetical protein [Actinomadura sp. BRA 177]|uniref:hypothetical protein n=1 Tax=Actinomadura sp. BRA 177 TaxID=2745202 RepID=UPI00159623BD|nr:hypothetical protein [Actinomadura sp. BRA 177]NVI89915.1 hypothetical protein [Actinomadura sp. BRA 177]